MDSNIVSYNHIRDIKKHIVLIKSNMPCIGDPRLAKEITSFINNGYRVTMICWDREHKSVSDFTNFNPNYHEISLRIKAPCGPRIVPFWPLWWLFVGYQLIVNRYDVIHAINFDSIIPSGIIAKIRNKSIVYEMFDPYEDLISMPLFLRNILLFIDKFFMRIAKAVIVVDESRIREFNGIPNKVVVIYNSPPDSIKKLNLNIKNSNIFKIFYAGMIDRSRPLDKMIDAIRAIDGVELTIAGFGENAKEIEQLSLKYPKKVRYIGRINYEAVINHTLSSDLLFSFYNFNIPVARFAASNKLFEAMMCGKPILVSSYSAMADIVERENCGLAVDNRSIEEIRNSVEKLKRDRDLCFELGLNGRKAYETKYNWTIMEKRLISLYEDSD